VTAAVSARGVRKSYGDFEALRGVDLEIGPGEVFALLGPNGAGKTTFVEILEGFRARSGGEATVLGVDPERGDLVWRSRLGIVLQSAGFFEQLTPDEVVSHFATFYPNPLDPRRVVDMVGLADKRSSRCKDLSGGQKRRGDLAMGIVGDPELVFLDEPTTGLDPQGRRQLWEVVREFARLGKTIVLTTHYLDEAEQLADRVGVIINGQLVEVGTPREIGGRERALARVTFALTGNLAGMLSLFGTETVNMLTNKDFSVVMAFLLMGGFAGTAGISADIYRVANVWIGHFKGGLSMATILGCAGFGAIAGSSMFLGVSSIL